MTRLATDPLQPNLAGPRYGEWMNFTAFIRIVPEPMEGRRFEYVRACEKLANQVEDDLKAITNGSFGAEIVIPGPVMFTHQFAQRPARLTITGFVRSEKEVYKPLTDKTVEQSDQIKTGPTATGGTLHDGVNTTPEEDDDVKILKAALESASPTIVAGNIFRLELNGVLYGLDGRSFPL